jgi:hypothetical protein
VLEECWSRTMELHKLDVVVAGHYSPECVEGVFSDVRMPRSPVGTSSLK